MAIKDNSELNTQVAADLPDNTTGLITPSKLRGVLANISDSLFNRKTDRITLSVDNVSELRALTSIPDGVRSIRLLGYYAPRDDGGGSLFIDRTDTTTVDDGGVCFVTASGLRIKRNLDSYISLRQFGCVGNDIADDTTKVQAAINAAISLKKKLLINRGVFSLTATVVFRARGLIVEGVSKSESAFRWNGTSASVPALLISNCDGCRFSDFSIEFSANLECAIRLINDPAHRQLLQSTNDLFENINIGYNSRGNNKILNYAIEITAASGKNSIDANNDLHRFINVAVAAYTEAGFHLEICTQAHDLLFIGCGGTGVITSGKYVMKHGAGFFTWINGSGGFSTVSDFLIGATSAPISIIKWNSEHSNKFLLRTETSNAPQSIRVEGVRFESEVMADDFWIQWNGLAGMVVEGCYVNFYDTTKTPRILIYNFDTNTDSQRGGLFHYNNVYASSTPNVQDRISLAGGKTSVLSFNNYNINPQQERLRDIFGDMGEIAAKSANFTNVVMSRQTLDGAAIGTGSFEFDGINLFFSNGIERKLISALTLTVPALTSSMEFTYATNGDTNGLFYYLGTNLGSQPWSNPATGGLLAITTTTGFGNGGRILSNLVDRTNVGFDNVNSALATNFSSVTFDIGINRQFICKRYSIRNNTDFAWQPRTWKLRGSSDQINWIDLDVQINNNSLRSGGLEWLTLPTSPIQQAFRYFNLQIFLESQNTKFIYVGEIELYGTLGDNFNSPKDVATTAWEENLTANGGAASQATITAVDNFIKGCKADNIWDLFHYVNLRCGNNLAAATTALKSLSNANNKDTLNTTTGSFTYSEAVGLRFIDGAYIVPGFTEQDFNYTTNGAFLGAYTGAIADHTNCLIGTLDTNVTMRFIPSFSNILYGGLFFNQINVARVTNSGYAAVSLVSPTSAFLDLTNFSPTATAVTTRAATNNALVIGRQGSDLFSVPTKGEVISKGLTISQSAKLKARLLAFQTALGRA